MYEVVQSYQGLQYTGESFYLLYEFVQSYQGLQYTGESFSLLYEVFQSDQGLQYTVRRFLCCRLKVFSYRAGVAINR